MSDIFEEVAQNYEKIAEELEIAAKHARISAKHYRDQNPPRACAHAFAGYGNIQNAMNVLNEMAILHASKAGT